MKMSLIEKTVVWNYLKTMVGERSVTRPKLNKAWFLELASKSLCKSIKPCPELSARGLRGMD